MENKPKKTIGLLLISTGLYDQFLQPLITSVGRHFFPEDNIIIYLFSDKDYHQLKLPSRISLIVTQIKHEPWPASTLFRYKHFSNAAKKISITEWCFYIDVDMMIVDNITDDILFKDGQDADLIVTRHPGFWNNTEWGSQGVAERSTAYLRDDEKHRYVCGGFNGGKTDKFLEMSRILADNIDLDETNGCRAPHNDETAINCFVNKIVYKDYKDWVVKDLTPSYCMLPDEEPRIKFGIEGLPAIIYALNKNHEELRKH